MGIFKRPVLTPEQIERANRIRAKGRKHFIFYRGILGFGAPVFVMTTFWSWYDHYGWHLPPRQEMLLSLLIGVPIWSACGYFFGAFMWRSWIESASARK